jgi:8-oxo-dGTP pyrophosphatase MutT (NUDIX family)
VPVLPPDPSRLLALDDLEPVRELAAARGILVAYDAWSDAQAAERGRMLAFVDEHPDALLRTCTTGHLTAATLLVDAAGERCLLTHHAKLHRWLQFGGHCDGDGNLVHVALREATEESGIEGLVVDPRPIDVDVHAIPARPGEPEHLHLDTRFLVWAPEGAREVVSAESNALGWFDVAD